MDNELPTNSNLTPPKPTNHLIWVIFIIVVLAVAGGIWYVVSQDNRNVNNINNVAIANADPAITTFNECVSAGNPIMNEFECSKDGRTFVKVTNTMNGYTMEYVVQSAGTEYMALTNSEFGFTVMYPNSYTQRPEPVRNGEVNLIDAVGRTSVNIWSTRTNERQSITWGEEAPVGDISLGGAQGKKFVYRICDGPGCTADIIAYVVIHNGNKYALEFSGNAVIDETEQRIIDSFTFQ